MVDVTIFKAEAMFPTEDVPDFATFIGYQPNVRVLDETGSEQEVPNPASATDFIRDAYKDYSAQFAASYLIQRTAEAMDAEKLIALEEAKARVAAAITVTVETAEV